MDDERRADVSALVALLRTRPGGLTWAEVAAEVLQAGSAVEVWERQAPQTLMPVPGEDAPLKAAGADVQQWVDEGMAVLSITDPTYPERLRAIHQAPPILFTRGALLAGDQAVSVVGSREASEPGLAIAAEVAHALAVRGITVASGLAKGVDAAAHRAALDAGGRTVAFVATGLRQSYPAVNGGLQAEIAERGLLISQFWPDAPPQKHNFLMRNATMSGYGLATIVVEAGERSGARAQARMAVEHGRPVILTQLVVTRNEWARAMVDRPGVHVTGSLGDTLRVVEELRQHRTNLDDALAGLVAAC